MVIKAIICTLDNLPLLKEQVPILQADPLISDIIIVNNGSADGTEEWLAAQEDLITINRENLGAGPGRNAGLDAAGEFDYVLMVDGGIRPLVNSVAVMLDYLDKHPDVDVISPEIMTCFTTDPDAAHRRLVEIDKSTCFPQRALSSTAYALCRAKAWGGIRFSEEGPFGKPGWGTDDNELQLRWNRAGILHHDFSGTMLYRRTSGSFQRLFQETGIWPNQYGSIHEQRNVLVTQQYPEYFDLVWHATNLQVSVVILGWNEYPMFAEAIKALHEDLKDVPHEIIFVDNGSEDKTQWWLDTFALRWPWGDTTIDGKTGEILKRDEELESIWTGNVIRVDLPENRGTGEGYTAGLDIAKGKYIFLTDGDIIPAPGSVLGLYEFLESHDDVDFIAANPWFPQDVETIEEVEFDGYENVFCDSGKRGVHNGLGNYAYGFSMFRREIIDAGVRHPTTGPFAGAGCSFDDVEFANQMYTRGFKAYVFNISPYLHKRRDLARSGHENVLKNIRERKMWLNVRWLGQVDNYDIQYHQNQPPERHMRRVAVLGRGCENPSDISFELTQALNDMCYAECFDLRDHADFRNKEKGKPVPGEWDDYILLAGGDWDRWECPDWCHPSVYWAVDMFYEDGKHRWPQAEPIIQLERAAKCDRVFCTHQNAVEFFASNGIEATRLPSACNPHEEYSLDVERRLDWTALWHHCGLRVPFIKKVVEAYPKGFCCYKFREEWRKWVNQGKCSFNVSRLGELNFRPFEIMAAGIPLITSRVPEMDEFFVEGEHYLGFDNLARDTADADEAIEHVSWVLANPEDAQAMADRARALVLDQHTFGHRAMKMFGDF